MEHHGEVDVALVVEAGGEDRTEHPQFCDLVLFAQGDNPVDVHLNQFHDANIINCRDITKKADFGKFALGGRVCCLILLRSHIVFGLSNCVR